MGWLDDLLERLDKYSKGIYAPTKEDKQEGRSTPAGTYATDDIFNRAVEFVLTEEGGYVNDPGDPGGETKFGISKRSYPSVDIKSLTKEKAKSIYYKDYWLPVRVIAEQHPELAIVVFDTGVNMGVKTAIKLLQNALGVPADGIVGPATRAKIESQSDTIVVKMLVERLFRYQSLSTWDKYRKGWTLRVMRLAMEVA